MVLNFKARSIFFLYTNVESKSRTGRDCNGQRCKAWTESRASSKTEMAMRSASRAAAVTFPPMFRECRWDLVSFVFSSSSGLSGTLRCPCFFSSMSPSSSSPSISEFRPSFSPSRWLTLSTSSGAFQIPSLIPSSLISASSVAPLSPYAAALHPSTVRALADLRLGSVCRGARQLMWINFIRCSSSLKASIAASRSLNGVRHEDEIGTSAIWSIVHRPIPEALLKSYAHHPTVAQPLILHGPRGVGKRTMIEGLMRNWNKFPHISAYIDLHANQGTIPPWTMNQRFGGYQEDRGIASHDATAEGHSFVNLGMFRTKLEQGLELLTQKAVELGLIQSENVVDALLERHAIDGALHQVLRADKDGLTKVNVTSSKNISETWKDAVESMRLLDKVSFGAHSDISQQSNSSCSPQQGQLGPQKRKSLSKAQTKSLQETFMSLALAKKLLSIQEDWRVSSGAHLKSQGIITRTSADAATSWAVLLLRLLSFAVQEGQFQPKLVVNNLDLMRKAAAESPGGIVDGSLYHDSLLMHITQIGVTVGCIPIIFVSSDSYYSNKVFVDHGNELAFISQEALGWTPKEAGVHLVPTLFEESEWKVITGVLGPTARHLAELHSIWHNPSFLEVIEETTENAMGDCIDLYLGYLQVTAVDPAMEGAIKILEKFAEDSTTGKIDKRVLRHGVAWRYPPRAPEKHRQWARIQLLDYIQAFAVTDFAVNHLDVRAQELLEDPATNALLEVGLLYQQKEEPYIRALTRGVSRCLVRWHVKERLNWSSSELLKYTWHRLIRGRFYKHLIIV